MSSPQKPASDPAQQELEGLLPLPGPQRRAHSPNTITHPSVHTQHNLDHGTSFSGDYPKFPLPGLSLKDGNVLTL